jgi:predicted small secreted protein
MRRPITFALVVATLVLAACANRSTGPGTGPDGIDHPSGADQIVLRVSYEGGFVAPSWSLTQIPGFALFGDGRVIVPGAQIEIYPGPALPAVSERILTEDGVQAILQAAFDAGLGESRDYTDMGNVGIADASTTVFTLSAAGDTSTVRVYALSELSDRPQGMPQEEFDARRRLSRFAERLGNLPSWLPEGSVGEEQPYDAAGYRLIVGDYQPDESLPQDPVRWPLDTAIADVASADAGPDLRCGTVVGQDWQALAPLAGSANQLTPWTNDGVRYAISFRPLLPDESTC